MYDADVRYEKYSTADEASTASWGLVWLLVMLFFVDSMSVWQCSPFLPNWAIDRGLNTSWLGVIFGVQMLSLLCTTLLSPILIRRSSQTAVLLTGTTMAFVSSLLTTIIPPLHTKATLGVLLILLRIMMGLGEGMMQVAGISILMRTVPESKIPLFTGLSEGMRALGGLIGPFLGGPLFDAGGWRLPFTVVTVLLGINLSGLLMLVWTVPHHGRPIRSQPVEAWELLKRPPVWAIAIVVCDIGLPAAMQPSLFEPYLSQAPFRLTPSSVGIVFGVLGVADIVAAALTGSFTLVVGHITLINIGLLLLITGCFLLALGPQSYGVFLGGCVMMNLGAYPVLICSMSLLLRVCRTYGLEAKAYSEVIASLVVTSVTLAMGVGSIFGGAIGDAIGLRGIYLVVACICCALPLVFAIGLSPAVLGRPLAGAADSETDAAQERIRQQGLESEPTVLPPQVPPQVSLYKEPALTPPYPDAAPAAALGAAFAPPQQPPKSPPQHLPPLPDFPEEVDPFGKGPL